MQINNVSAGKALDWFKCGWKIFSADMVSWVLMALILFAGIIVLGFIPLLGMIAIYLLLPLLQAGMIYAAQKVDRSEPIKVNDLFAAFNMPEKRSSLLALGGIMLAAVFAVAVLSVPFIGGSMLASMDDMPSAGTPVFPNIGIGGLLFAMTVGMLLAMSFFYAPTLIMLRGMTAVESIKGSFSAAWKNLLPFVVFMVIYVLLAVVAGIPFGLGFLVLLPVVLAASYCSYRDIFA